MADDTTYTGQSTQGATVSETNKRKAQAKNEGTMADKAAVQEGMKPGTLAAAAAKAAAKRKAAAKATPTPTPTPSPVAKKVGMAGRSLAGRRA